MITKKTIRFAKKPHKCNKGNCVVEIAENTYYVSEEFSQPQWKPGGWYRYSYHYACYAVILENRENDIKNAMTKAKRER